MVLEVTSILKIFYTFESSKKKIMNADNCNKET